MGVVSRYCPIFSSQAQKCAADAFNGVTPLAPGQASRCRGVTSARLCPVRPIPFFNS